MEKLRETQILVKNATLKAVKFDKGDEELVKFIDETKQKQAEILKLKEVDQDRLRMIVQF